MASFSLFISSFFLKRTLRFSRAAFLRQLKATCVPNTACVLTSESNVMDFQTFGKS
jgi:hypothetical protein